MPSLEPRNGTREETTNGRAFEKENQQVLYFDYKRRIKKRGVEENSRTSSLSEREVGERRLPM